MNPYEIFTSEAMGMGSSGDWVTTGGAKIIEVDGSAVSPPATSASDRSMIKVRYDTASASAAEGNAATITASNGMSNKTKKRTVFKVSWQVMNYTANLDADNKLRFTANSGDTTNKAGFNWTGEDNASRPSAKAEAILAFLPTGIDWVARHVEFKFGDDASGAKGNFVFRMMREKIATIVGQGSMADSRSIELNDADWNYDGASHDQDTQYPTVARPNKAFSIDNPNFAVADYKQRAMRLDLRERAEWLQFYPEGSPLKPAWVRISTWDNAEWHVNLTAVLPNAAKGGENSHGSGVPAQNVPNTKPVATVVGGNQTVAGGVTVNLAALPVDDDNDSLSYAWTAPDGISLLPNTTAREVRFDAPAELAPYAFHLVVTDKMGEVVKHKPTSTVSDQGTVTVTVAE